MNKNWCFSWAYKNFEQAKRFVFHWSYGPLKSHENPLFEKKILNFVGLFPTVYKYLGKILNSYLWLLVLIESKTLIFICYMQSNFSVLVFEGFWSWPLVRVFGISDIASKSSKWMQNQEYLDKKRRNENLKKKREWKK